MTSDDALALLKACEVVIEAESQMDGMSPESQLAVLRSSVRTLAVVQRDLLKGALQKGYDQV